MECIRAGMPRSERYSVLLSGFDPCRAHQKIPFLGFFCYLLSVINYRYKLCLTAQGVRDNSDNDEWQNDDHDTNNCIDDGLFACFWRFLIAARRDIAEAANDEEQNSHESGNSEQNIDDSDQKTSNVGVAWQSRTART